MTECVSISFQVKFTLSVWKMILIADILTCIADMQANFLFIYVCMYASIYTYKLHVSVYVDRMCVMLDT